MGKKTDVRLPRYMRKILRELPRRQLTPGFHEVTVYHDDGCAIWRGGACDCDPDIGLPFPGRS